MLVTAQNPIDHSAVSPCFTPPCCTAYWSSPSPSPPSITPSLRRSPSNPTPADTPHPWHLVTVRRAMPTDHHKAYLLLYLCGGSRRRRFMASSSMHLFLGSRDDFRLSVANSSRFLRVRANVRPCAGFQVCPLRVACVPGCWVHHVPSASNKCARVSIPANGIQGCWSLYGCQWWGVRCSGSWDPKWNP